MMYPRLNLLKQFLKKDGVIFVSIDDNELNNLKFLLDEVFGRENFIAQLVWKKKYTGGKHARHYVYMHEYILVFARKKSQVNDILMPRPEKEKSKFARKDKHFKERGKYYIRPLKSNLAERPTLVYPIRTPDGKFIKTQWIVGKEKFKELLQDDRIEFTKKRDGNYQVCKKYYEMDGEGKVKVPSLIDKFPNTEGKFELKRIFGIEEGRENVFYTVKPLNLIKYLLNPFLDSNDLVLDSFAGTGTTGHVVLRMNKQDSGNRRFILVEMEADICNRITFNRLKSAIEGYSYNQNGKKTDIEGLGGGFSYCELGQTLFNAEGQISDEVSYNDLARHIYFCETGEPLPKTTKDKSPLLGIHNETAVYLLYNGVLKDKKVDGGNVLISKTLAKLPTFEGKKVIYGTACRFSDKRLRSENIIFKQTPYEIRIN